MAKVVPADDATWRGARVTVMGLGLFGGGVAVTRFAVEHGAAVTVTDLRKPEDLTESLQALEGLPVRYVLGRHEDEDFASADLVVVSPAVPPTSKHVALARENGVPTTTEICLFAERLRGPVIAVSGSNGKTTTTSLIGAIMQAHDARSRLGGNIGASLLGEVEGIPADCPVVLELSSFQLEWLGERGWAPRVGVLTNLSPNHLDWHGTFDAYAAAKRKLLAHQQPSDTAVLNADDDLLEAMASDLPGRVVRFNRQRAISPGAWVRNGVIVWDDGESVQEIMPVAHIPLVGAHNLENVLAAVAATQSFGVPAETIAAAVRSFTPVEHRLERFAEIAGVRYYNDSIATTPESAICALRSFGEREMVLIAGGYDKKIPFDAFGREIAARAGALIVLGVTAEKIAAAALAAGFDDASIHRVQDLATAVDLAARIARPGQAVVLSPACASYDQFRNFAERGRLFKSLVQGLGEKMKELSS